MTAWWKKVIARYLDSQLAASQQMQVKHTQRKCPVIRLAYQVLGNVRGAGLARDIILSLNYLSIIIKELTSKSYYRIIHSHYFTAWFVVLQLALGLYLLSLFVASCVMTCHDDRINCQFTLKPSFAPCACCLRVRSVISVKFLLIIASVINGPLRVKWSAPNLLPPKLSIYRTLL